MAVDLRIGALDGYNLFTDNTVKKTTSATQSFESMFNAAVDLIKETNQYQLTAEQLQTDFATGATDDVLAVLLAQDKAFSSLNFTVQITNKIIESYREIMRMQI